MVEAISHIRQMMADSKFYEAQKTAELYLTAPSDPLRSEVLPIYLELLELQNRPQPSFLLLEAAENCVESRPDEALKWLEKIGDKDIGGNRRRLLLLQMALAEKKGRLDELYGLISEFQIYLFAARVPARVQQVHALIQKYFKHDFHLKLQELAVDLMLSDIQASEGLAKELIYSCVEKASPKGTKDKLLAVAEVLRSQSEKGHLELYQNYCLFRAEGIRSKPEYKKLAELFIYFDDFKFQVLLLDLLERLGIEDCLEPYAHVIRANGQYDFVYLDKYFPRLKKYFAKSQRSSSEAVEEEIPAPDLELEGPVKQFKKDPERPAPLEMEESIIISSLRYQEHSLEALIELAVSFLQSDFPRAGLKASELALERALTDREFLKAAYLKATCLYRLADHRACLDMAHFALNRAQGQDDILSFLYLQADALMQLGQKAQAKKTLKKIMAIDSEYRLASERLKRLDEV